MTEQQHNLSGDELADKAGEMARSNPDAARSVIDKIEDAVDSATGGKYSDAIDKAGDMVEEKLGLPNNQAGTEPAEPSAPQAPAEPQAPEAPADAPAEAPAAPSEPSVPFPDDATTSTQEVPGSPETSGSAGGFPTEPTGGDLPQ